MKRLIYGTIAACMVLISCQQNAIVVPASLSGPRAMTVAKGEVCLASVEVVDGIFEPFVTACEDEKTGSIGLIVNDQLDRVAVLDMSLLEPRLVDLDASVPGISHMKTGRRPISIAVNDRGTVAYTANQLDRTLSIINIWYLRSLEDTIELPGTPTDVRWSAANQGVVVGLSEPSGLWLKAGTVCEKPGGGAVDRRTVDPSMGCTVAEDEGVLVSLPFGTLSATELSPDGKTAYVLYADRPVMSVVALSELADGDTCINGGSAPCEVARVGLTHGCQDGLDNDGDGNIDQQDIQCFGPLHGEDAQGLSRKVTGACADGLDNDGDGLFDRDDPDCTFSFMTSEDMPLSIDPAVCSDGSDNDGDGQLDYPAEAQCYGPNGRRESAVKQRGFTKMGIDELGVFLYVADGANQQVLIVDLARRTMIDAPRSAQPAEVFSSVFGVRLGRTPVPSALTGRVSRAVFSDPNPDRVDTHAIIRYDFGAYVAADNGFVYYVDTARVYCEVEASDGILGQSEFYDDPEKLAANPEAKCLQLPAFPLPKPAVDVESCEEIFLCQDCLESTGGNVESCTPCEGIGGDFDQLAQSCSLANREFTTDGVKLVVNPRFSLRDRLGERGGVFGRAVCRQPEALITSLETFASENGYRGSLGCGSTLMPQPLSVNVPTSDKSRPVDFLTSDRLDFVEERTLVLEFDDEEKVNPVVEVKRKDERFISEDISVVYEGIIPSTKRSDGLAPASDAPENQFDIGSLDVCRTGLEVGDLLVINTTAGTESGGLPDGCDAFVTDEEGREDFLTYRIEEVKPGALTLSVIPNEEGKPTYAQALPTRTCFPRALSYEIRPSDAWIVYGSVTGVASGSENVGGVCVPTQANVSGRAATRVKTGEAFKGLYYSFVLYPGRVAPVRDTTYTMQVIRNFSPASTENFAFLEPESALPAQVLFVDRVAGGRFIFVPDASDDIIFGQNLATGGQAFGVR